MRDPYEILGVARTATTEEIRKAYRRLVKTCHPDLHPGDRAAEQRFKDLSSANEILGDPDKRARFDRGEIDASGAEKPQREYYRDFADRAEGAKYGQEEVWANREDLEQVFADLFGKDAGHGRTMRMRGPDLAFTLEIDLVDAARGARRAVTAPDGRTLQVKIPQGIREGQTLRLKGMGGPGLGGGEAGDAYVQITIRPHAVFRRKDEDIHIDLPVTMAEAVLGAKVEVPTVSGPVTLTIKPGSNTGTTLRLKGKGMSAHGEVPAGDQYVRLHVVLPKVPDAALTAFLESWQAEHAFNPRQELLREVGR